MGQASTDFSLKFLEKRKDVYINRALFKKMSTWRSFCTFSFLALPLPSFTLKHQKGVAIYFLLEEIVKFIHNANKTYLGNSWAWF